MKQRKYPEIGTVSHGTLRTEDLFDAFLPVLEEYAPEAYKEICKEIPSECDADWHETEEASLLLNEEVFEAMDSIAPPYCYFGATEGDGSDFGFWPCESLFDDSEMSHGIPRLGYHPDSLRQLRDDMSRDRYQKPRGHYLGVDPETVSEYLHVSDHGNAELYAWDGERFVSVWSVV